MRLWERVRKRGKRVLVFLNILPRQQAGMARVPQDDPNETFHSYCLRNSRHVPYQGRDDDKGIKGIRSISFYKNQLTLYEEKYIQLNRDMYVFTAGSVNSKNWECHNQQQFTDKDNNYVATPGDHIDFRYDIQCMIGEGSYSQVYKCIDRKNNKTVAVKMMKRKLGDPYQEAAMLLKISKIKSEEKSNIVQILHCHTFRKHSYLVEDYYDCNLAVLLSINPFYDTQGVVKMLKSVLNGLAFLRLHKIVHGDLKPANILFNRKDIFDLKIADFGLSVMADQPIGARVFQTTTYRAPEVMLGGQVTCGMDMWSFGVILSQMVGMSFLNGRDEREQFIYILEYFGLPPDNFFVGMSKWTKYFSDTRLPNFCMWYPDENGRCELNYYTVYTFPERKNPGERKMRDLFDEPDLVEVCNFLYRCFQWEPEKRIHPAFALKHPLFMNLPK